MNAMPSKDLERALKKGLRELRLPGMRDSFQEMAALARQESLNFERFLLTLVEQEQQSRTNHRIDRFLCASHLPREKNAGSVGSNPIAGTNQSSVEYVVGRWLSGSQRKYISAGPSGYRKNASVMRIGERTDPSRTPGSFLPLPCAGGCVDASQTRPQSVQIHQTTPTPGRPHCGWAGICEA